LREEVSPGTGSPTLRQNAAKRRSRSTGRPVTDDGQLSGQLQSVAVTNAFRKAAIFGDRFRPFRLWIILRYRNPGYAREVLHAKSLVSYIDPRNAPSIRLAKRLGAAHEGTIELATYGSHCVFRRY
jgi:hypothetical protein